MGMKSGEKPAGGSAPCPTSFFTATDLLYDNATKGRAFSRNGIGVIQLLRCKASAGTFGRTDSRRLRANLGPQPANLARVGATREWH